MTKKMSVNKLRVLLQEMFDAKYKGANASKHARAQGLVDGYMQAIAVMRLIEDQELLSIVCEERAKATLRAEVIHSQPSMSEASLASI